PLGVGRREPRPGPAGGHPPEHRLGRRRAGRGGAAGLGPGPRDRLRQRGRAGGRGRKDLVPGVHCWHYEFGGAGCRSGRAHFRESRGGRMLPSWLSVSDEVAAALEAGRPVVALESTLIAHGLPWPANLATARDAEAEVRDGG